MSVKNIKSIKDLNFDFPLEKGLYAITGENGSGKSTLITCASTVFFNMPMIEYFGKPQNASISFQLNGAFREWICNGTTWSQTTFGNKMCLNGFYEGSVIFGNRFKDNEFSSIRTLDRIHENELVNSSSFVKENLGLILHDNINYYSDLFVLNDFKVFKLNLKRPPYFIRTKTNEFVSQVRMSTGENLLISILHSLKIVYDKRISKNDGRPCVVFLDEIELALHSSALRRLILFLKNIANELGLAIFFSTHSIELLREIKAPNIYYMQRNVDDSVSVTNPCYPAYATRNLYSEDGFGNDMVILVEDDLAKCIVEQIIKEKSLINNIRIKVLPTGGWTNTITMAYDVISSNLLLKGTKLVIVLDRDIQNLVPDFLNKHKQYSGLSIDFLPINSLEKYIRDNLFVKFNNNLFNILNTYVFQKRPLNVLLESYKQEIKEDDLSGKQLYGFLINELRSMRKDREDLIEIVVKYIMTNEAHKIEELAQYLKMKIEE